MATVIIIVRDEEDEKCNITLESEPPMSLRDEDSLTNAQLTALLMLNAAADGSDSFDVK